MTRGGENSTAPSGATPANSAGAHHHAGSAGSAGSATVAAEDEEDVGPADWSGRWLGLGPGAQAVTTSLAGQQGRALLPFGPGAPGAARRFTRAALDAWHLSHATDAVELVVSELVTNAVQHARPSVSAPVRLVLNCDDDVVRVEVHDGDAGHTPKPSHREPGELSEGGRGLALIQALGLRWGCHRIRAGKAVWCELPAHL